MPFIHCFYARFQSRTCLQCSHCMYDVVLQSCDCFTNWMIRHKHDSPTHTSVITYIRTKLRFALLRSTLAAIRGFRGKRSDVHLQDFTDIDFSLIPRPTVTQINKAEQQCYKWCQWHDTSYICEIIKWVVYIDKLWLFVKLYLRTK